MNEINNNRKMSDSSLLKRNEQYPLLKVEGSGGDSITQALVSPSAVSPGWKVTCASKPTWFKRWPEFISTCWMTIMLSAITFAIFYALGTSAHRCHPVVVLKCNNTRPGSDVFYHAIIPQNYVAFSLYSDFLSNMAIKYPLLHFHVYYLIDDTRPMKRLTVEDIARSFNTVLKHQDKREMRYFQQWYQNVNISVMHLSKYMGMTPLRYKWRMLPQRFLTFYARVYEIWQHGGIAFDLVSFNNQYNNKQGLDPRIDAILKQHSHGVEIDRYEEIINSFGDNDKDGFFLNFFDRIFHQMSLLLNTDFIFDSDLVNNDNSGNRAQRYKRDVNVANGKMNELNDTSIINSQPNMTKKSYDTSSLNKLNLTEGVGNNTLYGNKNISNSVNLTKMNNSKTFNASLITNEPEISFLYMPGFANDNGPAYLLPEKILNSISPREKQQKPHYLLISPEGNFIAAVSRSHPFLSQLLSTACYTIDPKYAINDVLLRECSVFVKDVYCDSIRVINIV